jgi:hypothetical protein
MVGNFGFDLPVGIGLPTRRKGIACFDRIIQLTQTAAGYPCGFFVSAG